LRPKTCNWQSLMKTLLCKISANEIHISSAKYLKIKAALAILRNAAGGS
jgi:hypothetical protein